jgi:hypothetical protein
VLPEHEELLACPRPCRIPHAVPDHIRLAQGVGLGATILTERRVVLGPGPPFAWGLASPVFQALTDIIRHFSPSFLAQLTPLIF